MPRKKKPVEEPDDIIEPDEFETPKAEKVKGSTRDGPRYVVWELDPKRSYKGCSVFVCVYETEKLADAKEKCTVFSKETERLTKIWDRLDQRDVFETKPQSPTK